MALIFASPATPPPVNQAGITPSIEMTWTSWDGTEWDLVSGRQGVALQSGVRGLNMPSLTRYAQTSAGVHGSRGTGWIAKEREVFWPTLIYKPSGDPTWGELDGLFWRSMHPERPGTWTVTGPAATSAPRTLSCTYESDGGHSLSKIPSVRGWETYGVYLTAEKPFWMGERVKRSWGTRTPTNFFGSGAPSFNISSGSSVSTATVSNPGDVDAWPEWTVVGPIKSGSIGLNGRSVNIPFNIPAGKAVYVDTDPSKQTILYGDWIVDPTTLEGRMANTADRFMDMGQIDFAPIPSGEDLPLQLTLAEPGVGAGVVMHLTPRYFRAW